MLKPVIIMHPGCRRPIFALPAFPYPRVDVVGTVQGADHRLVLDACRILTNYAAEEGDCYLSKDRGGRHPIPRHNDVLAFNKYYYHPGAPSTRAEANYPIVTDFAAWKFPDEIPDHWIRRPPEPTAEDTEEYQGAWGHVCIKPTDDDMWHGVTANDGGCVVTKYLSSYGVFHLVPRERGDWFKKNRMARYSSAGELTGIHDIANGLTLRLDLGDCFEHHGFVFYPAPEEGIDKFMTSVCRWKLDYVDPFHRRLVTISQRVSREFLYARFAHTMIKLVDKDSRSRFNSFPIPEGVAPSKYEYIASNDHYAESAETQRVF